MNRLGVFIDLAHVSAGTMRNALQWSRSPVIFSHSNAKAVWNSSRNAPDDVFQMLKENNGLVMVNSYPGFVGDFSEVTKSHSGSVTDKTMDDLIKHIVYIKELIGSEFIGVGCDFDGIETVLNDSQDVSVYKVLFEKLENEYGFSEDEILGIKGKNFLRVMREMERVSAEMKLKGVKPNEAWIGKEELEFKEERVACRTDVELH